MFCVAIIGHSNVPRRPITIDGCEIQIFRSPGAEAAEFDENPVLNRVLG